MGKGVWLLVVALALLGLSEAASFGGPVEYDIFTNNDIIRDTASDFIPSFKSTSDYTEVEEVFDDESEIEEDNKGDEEEEEEEDPPAVFEDPKVYGMNIGLHFILENIKKRLYKEKSVHLEHLIKVLVLTHQIEKAGGDVNDCNMMSLKKVAPLYPKALKKAIFDASDSSRTDFF